jgi:hypothetical protein
MDNDTLIDQARHLYAVLQIKQSVLSIDNKAKLDRLEHLVMGAYCRYQRRLNRCVLCYDYRLNECNRETGKNHTFCSRRNPPYRTVNVIQDATSIL